MFPNVESVLKRKIIRINIIFKYISVVKFLMTNLEIIHKYFPNGQHLVIVDWRKIQKSIMYALTTVKNEKLRVNRYILEGQVTSKFRAKPYGQ